MPFCSGIKFFLSATPRRNLGARVFSCLRDGFLIFKPKVAFPLKGSLDLEGREKNACKLYQDEKPLRFQQLLSIPRGIKPYSVPGDSDMQAFQLVERLFAFLDSPLVGKRNL